MDSEAKQNTHIPYDESESPYEIVNNESDSEFTILPGEQAISIVAESEGEEYLATKESENNEVGKLRMLLRKPPSF
jgi:hypothetical protein